MSIINNLVDSFEKSILKGKRKLTEHERLMFTCGIYEAMTKEVDLADTMTSPQEFLDHKIRLRNECEVFQANSLLKFHAMFCEGCAAAMGDDDGKRN